MAEQPWHENPDPGLTVTVTELLVLRPAGLIGTIVGTAFFVAFSPLTALANIPPPNDAFVKTADVFIVTPARYTFERPFGAVAYDPSHY